MTIPTNIATWAERIYLQHGDSPEVPLFHEVYPGNGYSDGVTWCQDRIEAADVEYVRVDLAAAPVAAQEPILAGLDKIDALVMEWQDIGPRPGGIHRVVEEIRAQLAAAPVAAQEQDAARYQFLRNRPFKDEPEDGLHITFAVAEPPPNHWRVHSVNGEYMDAAIDARRNVALQPAQGEPAIKDSLTTAATIKESLRVQPAQGERLPKQRTCVWCGQLPGSEVCNAPDGDGHLFDI